MFGNSNRLAIGNLEAGLPIIQGGMGIGISLNGLAAAVANTGAIGVISAAEVGILEKDYVRDSLGANIRALKKEIRRARKKTRGLLGVNIMAAMTHFAEMVKVSLEEKIDLIFVGAGLPLTLPSFLNKDTPTRLVPIVSSARAAALISKRWFNRYSYTPDAIVVEGPLAGGHLGFSEEQLNSPRHRLEKILVETRAAVKSIEELSGKTIPLIAGGGIYTGADIYKFLQLGASGVQMATRFVTTTECDASPGFKQAYIDCEKEDIGIIQSPVGLPGRAIINNFLAEVNRGNKRPYRCPYHCITTCKGQSSPYCISLALMNAKKGRMKNGFAFAGVNAYRTKEIVSVETLIQTLAEGYNRAVAAANP